MEAIRAEIELSGPGAWSLTVQNSPEEELQKPTTHALALKHHVDVIPGLWRLSVLNPSYPGQARGAVEPNGYGPGQKRRFQVQKLTDPLTKYI